MRFLVCRKMDGQGCDYTIGCGMIFGYMEADSVEACAEAVIWPYGRGMSSSLEGEMALADILIVPAEAVVTVDVDKSRMEITQARMLASQKAAEDRERKEFERLRAKYS